MVNFFKYSGPVRYTFLFILLLLLRVPFFIKGFPLLYPELEWMIAGEKLAEGFSLYKDLWISLEPFSGFTYYVITGLFGKHIFIYHLLATILVYIQALLFNYMSNRMSIYNERSTFPALFYILFSSLFVDFFTLSPVLLSMTFLLLAFYVIIIQIKYKTSQEGMLYLGLFTSIGFLFYLPVLIFLPFFVVIISLYSTLSFRKFLLMLVGFLLPILLVTMYYFLLNSAGDLWQNLFLAFLHEDTNRYINISGLVVPMLLPVAILITSFIVLSGRTNYVNFQYNMIKVFLLLLIAGGLAIFFSRDFITYQIYTLVPVFAFFAAHIFVLVRKKLPLLIGFWAILFLVPIINAAMTYDSSGRYLALMKVDTKAESFEPELSGKKILVIGPNEPSLYLKSSLGTPYYSWNLSKRHLLHTNNMNNLAEIYKNFQKDLPEIIIDRKMVMDTVFYRIPILEKKYEKIEDKQVYRLKN